MTALSFIFIQQKSDYIEGEAEDTDRDNDESSVTDGDSDTEIVSKRDPVPPLKNDATSRNISFRLGSPEPDIGNVLCMNNFVNSIALFYRIIQLALHCFASQ